jgi:hypothetical protein
MFRPGTRQNRSSLCERAMMTMKRQRIVWSMRTDRELIALSKTKTLEALVDHFKRPPTTILTKAKRLALSIKRSAKGT